MIRIRKKANNDNRVIDFNFNSIGWPLFCLPLASFRLTSAAHPYTLTSSWQVSILFGVLHPFSNQPSIHPLISFTFFDVFHSFLFNFQLFFCSPPFFRAAAHTQLSVPFFFFLCWLLFCLFIRTHRGEAGAKYPLFLVLDPFLLVFVRDMPGFEGAQRLLLGRRLIICVNNARERGGSNDATLAKEDLITHNVKQNTIKHTPNATIFRCHHRFFFFFGSVSNMYRAAVFAERGDKE
jgi:hypothetical protein